jgi:hypothetical protein
MEVEVVADQVVQDLKEQEDLEEVDLAREPLELQTQAVAVELQVVEGVVVL